MSATVAVSTEEAFWRAIGACPEDALLRGVLADYLDEQAVTVRCGECEGGRKPLGHCDAFMFGCEELGDDYCECKKRLVSCGHCSGTGWVPDGRHDQADALRATADRMPDFRDMLSVAGYSWSWVPDDLFAEYQPKYPGTVAKTIYRALHGCGTLDLYHTAELAVRDLARAWVVTRNGGKG